jgi:predicted nucleic-acid-binding Zn-ribbon protein
MNKRVINWMDDANKAFVCPKCKNLRYVKFSTSVVFDIFDEDIIPNINFKIKCQFCGNEFTKYTKDGIDSEIADKIVILENKCYNVKECSQDGYGNNSTTIIFEDKLPKEAIDLLSSAWTVVDYNDGTAISNQNPILEERMESLAIWVDKLPERWKICPTNVEDRL